MVSNIGIAMIAIVKTRNKFGESPGVPVSAAMRPSGGVGAIAAA